MTTQSHSIFPPLRTEKAVEKTRKTNGNRIDPRWPPGRRRKWKKSPSGRIEFDQGSAKDRRSIFDHLLPSLPLSCNFLLEIIIFLILIASSRAICPSKCVCNDKLLKAVCEKSNLEVVPIQLNPEIKSLRLNGNRIGNVHLTFIFYTNLIELDLSENKIRSLGSKNFEFQLNLIRLNVSRNSIGDLHRDAFKGLIKLTVLDLSGNRIEEISDRSSFRDLRSLRELDLSRNNLYVLGAGVFDHLIDLKRLILSENQLTKIPENGIDSLAGLAEIDLDSNLIEDLTFSSNLPSLEILRIRSNLIRFLTNETFENLPRLRRLDLSDNNLTRVPIFQISHSNHLEWLNLSSNLFDRLESNSFRNLHRLREIQIDGGPSLSRIDPKTFSGNPKLNYVSLSNNRNLKRIPKFLFRDKPELKHLRISGNDFSTLDASDLPLDQLETLSLGRNPFVCNCSLHWLWILKERQVRRNCTCPPEISSSCPRESCRGGNLPESEKLVADREGSEEEEEEEENSESAERRKEDEDEEEEEMVEKQKKEKGKKSRLRGFAYEEEIFPIILDLDEIYCERKHKAERIPLKNSPKSDFDCTATWIVVLTAAILSILFILLLTAFAYVMTSRCRKGTKKNPAENFVKAAKNYEDSHRTYYECGGEKARNGDVFEVLKSSSSSPSGQEKSRRQIAATTTTNVYIRSPLDRAYHNYAGDFGSSAAGGDSFRKQLPKAMADEYREIPRRTPINLAVGDSNVYQEPFAAPVKIKNQRPPHIVYV